MGYIHENINGVLHGRTASKSKAKISAVIHSRVISLYEAYSSSPAMVSAKDRHLFTRRPLEARKIRAALDWLYSTQSDPGPHITPSLVNSTALLPKFYATVIERATLADGKILPQIDWTRIPRVSTCLYTPPTPEGAPDHVRRLLLLDGVYSNPPISRDRQFLAPHSFRRRRPLPPLQVIYVPNDPIPDQELDDPPDLSLHDLDVERKCRGTFTG
jgi:hypothetical protein